jgi:hypothetical protein
MPVDFSAVHGEGRRACGVLLLAFFALFGEPAAAAPYRPTDDSTVLATVPPAAAADQSDLRKAQRRLSANPTDLATALDVARLAIHDGETNADLRSFGQAQAALGPWWAAPSAPTDARLLRAVIRQNLHDFAGAEADLDAILAAEPQNGEARLARASVRRTTGALSEAKEDCALLPPSVDAMAAAICIARVEAATGSAAKALERLTRVLATDDKAAPELRRAAQTLAAETAFGLGETEEANRRFGEAVANSEDIPTLVAYADYLLDVGRPAEALTLFGDRSDADVVLLRLAIAGKALNDPRASRWSDLLAERFAADRANGVEIQLREAARFELEVKGDARAALGLAQANWKTQKEIADARLVLQAALAADDPAAAADALRFIKATGLADRRIKSLQDQIAEKR